MKYGYYKQVAELYIAVSDMRISQSEFIDKVKKISIQSDISVSELINESYFYSFKN